MNARTTGIVSYFTWIGWLIALLAGDREGAKFHLNQSLVILLFGLVSYIPTFNFWGFGWLRLVKWVWGICMFVCWIIGLIAAVNQEEREVPIIGKIKLIK